MIGRDASRALRLQFVLAILVFIGAGVFSAWLGLSTLASALDASAAGRPIVAFQPLYVVVLPLSPSFFALATLALLPAPAPTGRGRRRRKGIGAAGILFGIAVGGALLAIVAAPVARWAIAGVMRERGYGACPPSDAERRPPMRWARPGAACP